MGEALPALFQTRPEINTKGSEALAQCDLEALRLEVEALRVSLQETRDRVRALEEKGQLKKMPPSLSITSL